MLQNLSTSHLHLSKMQEPAFTEKRYLNIFSLLNLRCSGRLEEAATQTE